MKLLLDECLPRKLKREFVGHDVCTIDEAGFKGLRNGNLIQSASEAGFKILVSVDKNYRTSAKQNESVISDSRFVGAKQSPRIAFTSNGRSVENLKRY